MNDNEAVSVTPARRRLWRRLAIVGPVVCLAGSLGMAAAAPPGVGQPASVVPLAPARILDTRDGLGAPAAGAIGPDSAFSLQVTGRGGVPANATGVILNITATEATAATYVTVWPTGEPRPNASVLNVSAGEDVANMITAALSADGRVDLYNSQGTVHLIADVAGYLLPDSSTGGAVSFERNTTSSVELGRAAGIVATLGCTPSSEALVTFTTDSGATLAYAGMLVQDDDSTGAPDDTITDLRFVPSASSAQFLGGEEFHFTGTVKNNGNGITLAVEVHVLVGSQCTAWGTVTPTSTLP